MEEARAVGAIVAFPAFADPGQAVPLPRRRPDGRRPVRNPPAAADRSAGRARRHPGAADRGRRPRHPAGPRQGPLRPRARPAPPQGRAADRRRLGGAAASPRKSRAIRGTCRWTGSPRPTGSSSSAAVCERSSRNYLANFRPLCRRKRPSCPLPYREVRLHMCAWSAPLPAPVALPGHPTHPLSPPPHLQFPSRSIPPIFLPPNSCPGLPFAAPPPPHPLPPPPSSPPPPPSPLPSPPPPLILPPPLPPSPSPHSPPPPLSTPPLPLSLPCLSPFTLPPLWVEPASAMRASLPAARAALPIASVRAAPSMRLLRVSALFADSIQQIHSLRASGVMSTAGRRSSLRIAFQSAPEIVWKVMDNAGRNVFPVCHRRRGKGSGNRQARARATRWPSSGGELKTSARSSDVALDAARVHAVKWFGR